MGVPTHLHEQFKHRVETFAHEYENVYEGDVDALHRTRVASRRLRELLPLQQLDPDLTRKLVRRLRKVTRRLGEVRELDVLSLIIQGLSKNRRYPSMALRRVGDEVTLARTAARERLAAKLPAEKLQSLARKLDRAAQRLTAADAESSRRGTKHHRRAPQWALEARLARRAAAVRTAIAAAGTVYAPEQLHGVRIALKKLRYSLELSSEARPRQTAADLASLTNAQDLLGGLHDLEMLLIRVRETQASLPASDQKAWRDFDTLVRAVEDDCRQLHADYMRDRARLLAIADRMSRRETRVAARRAAV